MTFIILAVLAFLIFMVFIRYKTVTSVILAILLVMGITTIVMSAGITALRESGILTFFNSSIGRTDFFYLMAAWYGADLFCSILIIRNHIAYKKINPGSGK